LDNGANATPYGILAINDGAGIGQFVDDLIITGTRSGNSTGASTQTFGLFISGANSGVLRVGLNNFVNNATGAFGGLNPTSLHRFENDGDATASNLANAVSIGTGAAITSSGAGGTMAAVIASGTATSAGTAIAAGASQTLAVTTTGSTTTDVATCATNAAFPATWLTGIAILPPVVTANTTTITIVNPTTASITPAAQTFRCTVMR